MATQSSLNEAVIWCVGMDSNHHRDELDGRECTPLPSTFRRHGYDAAALSVELPTHKRGDILAPIATSLLTSAFTGFQGGPGSPPRKTILPHGLTQVNIS